MSQQIFPPPTAPVNTNPLTVTNNDTAEAAIVVQNSALSTVGVIGNGNAIDNTKNNIGFYNSGGMQLNAVSGGGIFFNQGGSAIGELSGVGADFSVAFNASNAVFNLPNIPTSNPHVAGEVYSNLGILTLSAG
jgi:hypothetical protein